MTYAEYLSKVRELAVHQRWPWLCWVAADAVAACHVEYRSAAVEHRGRLLRTIKAQLRGGTFLPTVLREQRPDWPYPDADGKVIRLAWLREQIELAKEEEGACTHT